MLAIISDVHGNLEAFETVLKDINTQGISEIICLGDLIGYGPNPRECLKTARDFKFCLKGNHEEAVMYLGIGFNIEPAQAVNWTKDILNSPDYEKSENYALWDMLDRLSPKEEIDDCLYLHGSPREVTREYLRPRDVTDKEKMAENFALVKHICFCGHTHEPGVFVAQPAPANPQSSISGESKFYRPQELNNIYEIDERKCIINVGSVGQPRDRDNRACYITFDGQKVAYHRVAYDYKKTMKKILATKALPKLFATRLQSGR